MASETISEASGLEISGLDQGISPADDLYLHVNKTWLDHNSIPDDKSMYGAFSLLAEDAEKHVHAIVEEATDAPEGSEGSEGKKVGDLFRSFMDEDAIEQRGLSPLRERLDKVQAVTSAEELIEVMAHFEASGVSGLMELFVDNDPGQPDRYVVFVEQGGLSLPDESYYRDEQFAELKDAFHAHLHRVAVLVGIDDSEGFASRVVDHETKIAASHWDQVSCRDAQKTYNLVSFEQLEDWAQGFPLAQWADTIGFPEHALADIVVRQPSFVQAWGEMWSGDLESWKSWFQWHIIKSLSPYLTAEMVDAHFDFYGRTLSGTPSLRARWKRGVSFVESAMGEAVGKLYVERHFPPESKVQMDELVANLLEAYRHSITDLSWMSEETKKRALEKLDKFTPKIGYPEKWRDYSLLHVSPDDLLANVEASARFELHREMGKLGKPIDRYEWFMTPQTVNAYYNPGFNEIVFPAAILQYPFFDANRDTASNYGAIGAVIGHEIGHGFDDQGSRFDGDGALVDWWSEEDRARFEQLTGELVGQYAALEPKNLPGLTVNGELTLGENIGDLGGLAIAWKAYLISLDGEQPPVVDGLSAAQRFFVSWAQSWRLAIRDEEAKRLLQIDPHSPAEFRCNQIVRNLDLFYDAFEVAEDSALYLAPERRISIW
jgi:putative endopeptidase